MRVIKIELGGVLGSKDLGRVQEAFAVLGIGSWANVTVKQTPRGRTEFKARV